MTQIERRGGSSNVIADLLYTAVRLNAKYSESQYESFWVREELFETKDMDMDIHHSQPWVGVSIFSPVFSVGGTGKAEEKSGRTECMERKNTPSWKNNTHVAAAPNILST
jgi:hypothetical protein